MRKILDVQEEARRIWEETKKNLLKLSQETIKLAKRGEREIVRVSKIGKLHLDILGIKRKREILCQEIGSKVVALDTEGKVDIGSIKPLCSQVRGLDSQIKKKERQASRIKKLAKTKK